jgi:hypothetical protein
MARRPTYGDKAQTAAERQRRRRQKLGLDGPTMRFRKAVQLAFRNGLTRERIVELVEQGAVAFREVGPISETALAKRFREKGRVTEEPPPRQVIAVPVTRGPLRAARKSKSRESGRVTQSGA